MVVVFDSDSGINIGIGSEIYGNMPDDKKLPMSNYSVLLVIENILKNYLISILSERDFCYTCRIGFKLQAWVSI